MAWGVPIANVEVRIDDGPWQKAAIDRSQSDTFAWTMWSVDWLAPAPGVHSITSRAFDPAGSMQPATDDSLIAGKRTYWESNAQVTRRINIG
jgi:Mo-co oxidoreductase dimerisation domain